VRLVVRWSAAVALSAAAFVLSWWICQGLIGADEGVSLGIAGAMLAIVLAVAGWWAVQGTGDVSPDRPQRRLLQKARAGRDVSMAGRDQTIINYRHRDE
jgi:hypothetical protein